jgi:putative ABC transport system permease protein
MMRYWINWLSQTAAVTRLSLETVIERKGACAASVFGIAGVVAVLVAVLSIAQGFRRVMTASGDPARALVLRSGSDTEMMSFLLGPETRIIGDAPGVLHGPDGPLVSSELFVVINLPKRSTGTDANVPLRGLSAGGRAVHDSVRMVEGRPFVPGRNEVIVGIGAVREFVGLTLGSKVSVGRSDWRVVGIFEAAGGISESEIWTDATVLQSAYQRGNSFQTVVVRLQNAGAFDAFEAALMADPRLNVKVVRQTDYYMEQSRTLYRLVTGLGMLVAGLMALGAVFGALNTMYTAVAARTREIATLRALGFGGGPVVTSILIESLLLATVGGLLGGGGAYLVFDGYRAATMNWQSFSQVAFAFEVTPGLLAQGMAWALGIGLIGGLFPALRAARLPVARALREL